MSPISLSRVLYLHDIILVEGEPSKVIVYKENIL